MPVQLYLDTSAVMKMVFEEAGTDQVRGIWDLAAAGSVKLMSSEWLKVELLCATRARDHGLAESQRLCHALLTNVALISLDHEILTQAAALPYALRAGDAVHLATILRHGLEHVAVFDDRLAGAIEEAGLHVIGQAADLPSPE